MGPVGKAPERSWHASGAIFSPNRRFRTPFGPFLTILARADIWPGQVQALPIHGGRDSGRLTLSVPICPPQAATAADFKGGSGGAKPHPAKKKYKLFFGCLNLGEPHFVCLSADHQLHGCTCCQILGRQATAPTWGVLHSTGAYVDA